MNGNISITARPRLWREQMEQTQMKETLRSFAHQQKLGRSPRSLHYDWMTRWLMWIFPTHHNTAKFLWNFALKTVVKAAGWHYHSFFVWSMGWLCRVNTSYNLQREESTHHETPSRLQISSQASFPLTAAFTPWEPVPRTTTRSICGNVASQRNMSLSQPSFCYSSPFDS
jgi:hypothetical protein